MSVKLSDQQTIQPQQEQSAFLDADNGDGEIHSPQDVVKPPMQPKFGQHTIMAVKYAQDLDEEEERKKRERQAQCEADEKFAREMIQQMEAEERQRQQEQAEAANLELIRKI